MKIPKNTKKAKNAIANARNIRFYCLQNAFRGDEVAQNPTVWERDNQEVNGPSHMLTVTQSEFLARQLEQSHTATIWEDAPHHFHLRIHSNLWYEFEA